MKVVTARPAAAKAKPTRAAAGIVSRMPGEMTSPIAVAASRKPIEVSRPLRTALATSPAAMSAGESGVGTIAS